MTQIRTAAIAAVASLAAAAVQAAPADFDLLWAGDDGGSAAAALTIDDAIFGSAQFEINAAPAVLGITLFDLSVTLGAGGTSDFDVDDFDFIFFTSGPLDATLELTTQATYNDFNVGTGGVGVPLGINPNTFTFSGETFTLQSFAPATAIPLPASAALLLGGLGVAALVARRRAA